MTGHPQVGPPWDLPGAEAARFLAAVQADRETFLPGQRLRPGGHCEAKGGLTTLWAYDPAEEPDGQGRRPADMNVGTVLTPELARALCAAYNAQADRVPPP